MKINDINLKVNKITGLLNEEFDTENNETKDSIEDETEVKEAKDELVGKTFEIKGVKFKVIERAIGFVSDPKMARKYWVKVLKGAGRDFEEGDDVLMTPEKIQKALE